MKRKKLIMKKRALSWILALALSGSSLALPVSAAEPDDNVQVETYDETSDFENDADIEITDEGQDADGGASVDINVTEDGNEEGFSDFSDEETTDADIDVFASEEDGQAVTLSGTGTEADPYLIATAADIPDTIEAGIVYALAADITLTSGQQIGTIAGTLDGKGHVITLADKPLANSISGTIQNLGVTGSVTLTLADKQGSVANTVTNTGVIQKCYCTVNSQTSDYLDEIGGMIGKLQGVIQSSYFAGSTDRFGGGVAASISDSYRISHVLWTSGTSAAAVGRTDNIADDSKKKVTADQIKASLGVLNTEIAATGFYWMLPEDGRNNGLPVLQEGAPAAGEVNWGDLDIAIASAENLVKEDYTETTWNAVAVALKEAKELREGAIPAQSEINAAAKKLTDAIAALKKPNASAPMALPTDTSKITYITSQSDFSNMEDSQKDTYFVLKNDITLNSNYVSDNFFMPYEEFKGILDGQGHTITFDKAPKMFAGIATMGVIQNVGFKGTMADNSGDPVGPLGRYIRGSVINCWSNISGQNACGIAGGVSDEAVISNCFAYGESPKGGMVNTCAGSFDGMIKNTHWLNSSTAPTYPSGTLVNSGAVSKDTMKEKSFINTLNENRGDNGSAWGQSSSGFAYFGPDQTYTPGSDWPELPEGEYCDIAFTNYNASEAVTLEDAKLQVSPDSVNSNRMAGTFSLPGYTVPDGYKVYWSVESRKPAGAVAIAEEGGKFYVNKDGKATVKATLVDADGKVVQTLAYASVLSKTAKIRAIQLYIDNQNVTNGNYTIAGSATKSIKVKAQYEGETDFRDAAYSSFTYQAGDTDLIYNESVYSSFYFKKPGTSAIRVTSKNDSSVSATVNLTSTYVAVTSVRPALENGKVIEIHGRNANSDGQEMDGRVAFNPVHGTVIVTPENASYADNWEITSDNETIGYYNNGSKVYVPKQAGTVKYTATLIDMNPNTGDETTVTGTSFVTYKYKNPLTEIKVKGDTSDFSVKAKESATFTIEPKGTLSEQGYEVTEPSINWTFDKKGIAAITKTKSGEWKRVAGAPDTNNYFLCSEYKITGIAEGTVVATGTPVDQTNNPAPIKLTITVTKGDKADTDNLALAKSGADSAAVWIKGQAKDTLEVTKDDWTVFTLLRHGETLSNAQTGSYYDSVVEKVKEWENDPNLPDGPKPTDIAKISLALTMLEKDITDVDGVNLAEMMYNSTRLKEGSNELIWVLLALDAANIQIPADATWSRESMISALLEFQNANGFFGLFDNKTGDVDITAMALQPLARYQVTDAKVEATVKKAVTWLKGAVKDDFGYGTPESTAQVLIALSALGIDPTGSDAGFGTVNMNMITSMMAYKCEDGGFAHVLGNTTNGMATTQVLEALDAYVLFKKNNAAYWDVAGSAHVSHNWDEGVVTKEPTCTETGIKTYTCTECNGTKTEEIPALGHTWSNWTTTSEATVFAKEVQKRTCSVCKTTDTREIGNKLKATMKVSANTVPLKVKQSIRNFKVTGMAKGDSVKSWKSSNTKIVKVSVKANGTCKISAQKRTGTARITITLKSGLKKTIKIKVQKFAVKTTKITGFKGGKKSITLKKGKKFTLVPICKPISSREKVTFTSSNKKVAKVDSKGRIKALKPGKATITVKVGNKKAKLKVTVKK
ncbi:MAG: Ig-like domain-containing protein [Ruminococcus sp.]|nr:Ig-like domain-containing protein [Ruminococcus sp.]